MVSERILANQGGKLPELPEVETVRRGLEKVLIGQKIKSIRLHWEGSFQGKHSLLYPGEVTELRRRGKLLMIVFSHGWTLQAHLRMTGQLIYVADGGEREGGGHPNDDLVRSLPAKHTRITIQFQSKGKLYFNDQRKFGYLKMVPTEELHEESFLKRLGPEPWDEIFNTDYLHTWFQRRARTKIKPLLLDQSVIAGLGNIYVDEALFLTGILPTRPAGEVKKSELPPLIKNIQLVLERGIQYGGVSAKDYVNAEGLKGTMQEQLYVYGRKGETCKKCETPIVWSKLSGRGTHTCPNCQK